jgi:hypothetical protein
MNACLRILIALITLTFLSGCDPEGGVNLSAKCTGSCANHGGKVPVNPNAKVVTSGIYRDPANDHVATIDQNGRVLFWDDYARDRELEHCGLVQRLAIANANYQEENACVLVSSGTISRHDYSFTESNNTLKFNTSCGDARIYSKPIDGPKNSAMMLHSASFELLYNTAGDSLTLEQATISNDNSDEAGLSDNGYLTFSTAHEHCIQEYLRDQQALVLLDSPNCLDTGFEPGIYTP